MRDRPLCTVCLCLFVVAALMIHAGKDSFLSGICSPPLEEKMQDREEISLSGQVYNKEIREKYQILYLKNISVTSKKYIQKESRIILYDEKYRPVRIGQEISADGTIGLFSHARNPGGFDFAMYQRIRGICASVWASDIRIIDPEANLWMEKLIVFREKCREIYENHMPEKEAGILAAMLLGEKEGMEEEIKELYQVNGIGHILAISGLHISFIGIGIYQILRKITGSMIVSGLGGTFFLLLYIGMIGMTVSVLRAFVMFLFRAGADMSGRHYDSMTALSVAAVAVLLWRPLAIYEGGFWLSFGAVLALLVVYPLFAPFPFAGFWSGLSVNLVLLPVLLYYFYEFPLYSTILNVFIIPLMSPLLFCGIFGAVFCRLGEIAGFFLTPGACMLWACRMILCFYEAGSRLALKLPGARIVTGQPEIWQIILYYALLAAAVMLWRFMWKGNRIGAAVLCGIAVLSLTVHPGTEERLQVTVLDVGQGDGIFIRGPSGLTCLVDGGSSDVKQVGKYRIEPYLLSQGVRRLDYVFLSHGDSDHLNGILELLQRQQVGVEIDALVLPDEAVWEEELWKAAKAAKAAGTRVLVMKAGQEIRKGKMKIRCLAPDQSYAGEKGNAASMALAVSCGQFDMLLTGDLEGEGERLLTARLKEWYGQTRWEVLKTAHHGAKGSTSRTFLETVCPAYAVISAGERNRYGHPHRETLDRLSAAGSKIYVTAESGAVEIVVDKEQMKIRKQLN